MVTNACEFLTDALANLANALRMLVNASQMKRLHIACVANLKEKTHFQYFTLSLINQPPPNPLRMLMNCLRTCCENNDNMISARNLGKCT
jgi:hypothetical protein